MALLLGTLGLGVVLLRTVFERRSEFALLAAIGYSPLRVFRAVFTENAALLAAGILIGAGSAILGVLPSARQMNLSAMTIILTLIFAIGLCVIFLATRIAVRKVTPATLRTL